MLSTTERTSDPSRHGTPTKSFNEDSQVHDQISEPVKVTKKASVHVHEVSEKATDLEAEIKAILQAARQASSRIELLIDGSVFSKMLTLDKNTQVKLNRALNSASAVIIYRASPKQKEQVV